MARGFTFTLELENGHAADPPKVTFARPDMSPGQMIPISASKTFCIVDVRPPAEPGEDSVLVVVEYLPFALEASSETGTA